MLSSSRDRGWRVLLLLVLLHGSLTTAARGQSRHVLVLSSSERPFAPQSGFADALVRDLVRSSREPIDFVEVSVQAARHGGDTPDQSTAQRIRTAFASQPQDLVITIGGPAATFAQRFRDELFPATPVLIAGVDHRFVQGRTFSDNETSVTTQHDPTLMIDEILRLLPETRTVTVVVGASPLEQFWLREMKREFGRFERRLQFTWTNELSFEQIVEACRTMPPQSAIFFAILAVDSKGEPLIENDSLAALHAVANAPMFSLYGMGRGIVGGPLLSTPELSRTTAQVALRLLAGEPASGIKTPTQRSGQPTYDARELRRWNIDESRLPTASVVLFRELTAWQMYRRPVAIGVLSVAIPTVAILLNVRRTRRRNQRRTDVETDWLTPIPADATVRVWATRPDGERIDAGPAPAGALPGSWTASVHEDDVAQCQETYRLAVEKREPFQMEYRVRESGGEERWILDTGLPRFAGQNFAGYVGSTVDISRLRRRGAELSHLSRHLMQAHEDERAALRRTLHEGVCQRMVALTLRLHTLKDGEHGAEVKAIVADVSETLAGLASELAAVSDPVHQQLELLGLATVSRRFCEDVSRQHAVAVHFQDDDVPSDLPLEITLALFRVLEEATLNAIRHSGEGEIRVSLRGTPAEIRLHVVDRGVGFEAERTRPGDGVGLVALRERLRLVGGDSLIVSRLGEGTRVEAWVPVRSEGPAASR